MIVTIMVEFKDILYAPESKVPTEPREFKPNHLRIPSLLLQLVAVRNGRREPNSGDGSANLLFFTKYPATYLPRLVREFSMHS
jgi:hypothetical protein